ncbi:hypothetical protein GOV06_01315 [Candidatus Woesearchaeota archaeon]|nr:hypothetical protein [Candidatus Woesearchaeota archaeon]
MNYSILKKAADSTDPKIPKEERPVLNKEELEELSNFLFDSMEGRHHVGTALATLQDILGGEKVFTERLGNTYTSQVSYFYADLMNGKQHAHYFFKALRELVEKENSFYA